MLLAGTIVCRLFVALTTVFGLIVLANLLLTISSFPNELQPHAAVVAVSLCVLLSAAVTLTVQDRLMPAAAFLAALALSTVLLFYFEAKASFSCPLGLCWVTPTPTQHGIFGFAGFVTAIALLVIVYTVSDVRYRFRVQVAPLPLFKLTYLLIAVIGFGTLISDLWFAELWPVPAFLSDQLLWQASFGLAFLSVALAWLWFAFIWPPVFSKQNALRFTQCLYGYILRGWDQELPTIANELVRSAKSIVELSKPHHRWDSREEKSHSRAAVIANRLILLIGNRKFSRCVATSSPLTAIAFFAEASSSKKFHVPLGTFGSNVVTEALLNKDSILYHEDSGYHSGLIGYDQPFSKAVFGNFHLVEALAGDDHSPLDVNSDLMFSWTRNS